MPAIMDDNDAWKVPPEQPDRTHAARVRFVQHAIVRLILEIPDGVSDRSRAVRIGKIRERVSHHTGWLCETYKWAGSNQVRITDGAKRDLWTKAYCEGWNAVKDALDAGDDLAAFLFPAEVAS